MDYIHIKPFGTDSVITLGVTSVLRNRKSDCYGVISPHPDTLSLIEDLLQNDEKSDLPVVIDTTKHIDVRVSKGNAALRVWRDIGYMSCVLAELGEVTDRCAPSAAFIEKE